MDIRTIRKQLGMTQKRFAEEFHLQHRTLQKWEGGERPCPEYLLRLIADKAERMAGVTLVLDRSDAENLARLLESMSGYMAGAALASNGVTVTEEMVGETMGSVMRAFCQLDSQLAKATDAE
jgi:transcriptional regulator with XRE-family HTH domain